MKREFPTVGELSNGFSEFRLPQATELIGQEIKLYYENEKILSLKFLTEEVLQAKLEYQGESDTIAAEYTAVSPREQMYFIDFIWSYGSTRSVTTVVDFKKAIATTIVGTLPTKEEAAISQFERGDKGLPLTSVKVLFYHARVGEQFTNQTVKHEFSNDLVGERIAFQYSSNDSYEHIYLNEKYYTWHCISGVEKGLCDTDRCYFLKLDTDLYWFTWIERIVPTIGTVVEDLSPSKMRSYGKLYGYESYEMEKVRNFPAGSYATVLNKVEYPKLSM